MPYKFGEYVSTYVDPQSVKISEVLRDRFVQSFNAADAVGEELNKLKAADFESDQKLKTELDTKVRDNLSRYAQSGDYENMTFDVAATAKEYRDRSAPITENYNRYAEYQQKLAKDYEKGRISSSAYRNAIPMTKALGYSGLSIDPNTGMVDPKSYFSGMNIAKDPKITDRLIKVLGQIEADSAEKTITGLYTNPETGEMKYTSKQGWEGITEEKVARAYEAVMADPEVQNYLAQEGRFKAFESYSNPDGTLNADALNQVTASGMEMHKAEMDKLSALIGNPKTSQAKKQEYQATLNAYQQSMTYLSGLKDPSQQLNYAASLAKEELLNPYKAIAAGKVYNKTKSDYSEDYSEMEKEKRRAAITKQGELEKLKLMAESKITIDKEGGIDEVVDLANVESVIDKAQTNIKNDTALLNDPNAGEYEKAEARQRIATNQEQLALAQKVLGSNAETYVDNAVDALIVENPEVGDIDNWGFGTYGIDFSEVYNVYKSLRGSAANKKDFYRVLQEGPKGADYQALAQSIGSIHSGEDGMQILAESKASMDTKLKDLGSNQIAMNRTFNTKTAPIGTNPVISDATAAEIKGQFTTLGDLSGISGLIYRDPDNDDNQTVGTVGGEGGIIDAWGTSGFKAESKITNIRYGVANGMELTDKSQYGQYAILTVSPEAEGENAVTKRPYKEVYVPIEKVLSADQIAALNEPATKFQRHIQTVGMGTRYASEQQTYEFEKDFTDEEKRAIMFSNELNSKSSTEAAKFLKQNAETFEQYVAMGYLTKDGSFAGMPYQKLIIDVADAASGKSPKAQIFLVDVNGQRKPMTDPTTGKPAGYMDVNSEVFRSIVNDQNVGLYRADGYNLKTIK